MKSMEDIHTSSLELKQINQIIEDIQSKTQIINDIVFKTQLLSFNASIEAARAGQHGKGFAVVAEEIGKLAQISGDASHTITTLLESSKSSVMHIVGQTQESAEHGKTISQDVQVIFNTIDENILEINQMFQKVFEASREQELGIEQTNTALAQVEEGTKVNLQNADSSAQNAHSLNEISKDMVQINEYLNELIEGSSKDKIA